MTIAVYVVELLSQKTEHDFQFYATSTDSKGTALEYELFNKGEGAQVQKAKSGPDVFDLESHRAQTHRTCGPDLKPLLIELVSYPIQGNQPLANMAIVIPVRVQISLDPPLSLSLPLRIPATHPRT